MRRRDDGRPRRRRRRHVVGLRDVGHLGRLGQIVRLGVGGHQHGRPMRRIHQVLRGARDDGRQRLAGVGSWDSKSSSASQGRGSFSTGAARVTVASGARLARNLPSGVAVSWSAGRVPVLRGICRVESSESWSAGRAPVLRGICRVESSRFWTGGAARGPLHGGSGGRARTAPGRPDPVVRCLTGIFPGTGGVAVIHALAHGNGPGEGEQPCSVALRIR